MYDWMQALHEGYYTEKTTAQAQTMQELIVEIPKSWWVRERLDSVSSKLKDFDGPLRAVFIRLVIGDYDVLMPQPWFNRHSAATYSSLLSENRSFVTIQEVYHDLMYHDKRISMPLSTRGTSCRHTKRHTKAYSGSCTEYIRKHKH